HENGAIINEVNYSPLLAGPKTSKVMAELMAAWLPGSGRIPVAAVIGGAAAWSKAQVLPAERLARGERCWITSDAPTVAPDGSPAAVAEQGRFARCLALVLDPSVDAIVLVVEDARQLQAGLPVDRIDSIVEADDAAAGREEVRRLLSAYAPAADSM